MGTTSGGETLLATNVANSNNGIGALFYTVTGLTNGQSYYFKVAPTGTTTFSNESSATPGASTYVTDLASPQPYSNQASVDQPGKQPVYSVSEFYVDPASPQPMATSSPATLARLLREGLFLPGQ